MIQEGSTVWEQPNNYFDNMSSVNYPVRNVEKHQQTDLDSENEKRTSWGLEDDDDDEQQLRQELIQRATARLRRRLLEQGLQDVMSQVVSLQTQLETLRLDAATTIDTISGLFDDNDIKPTEGSQKMNRQMDVLERRLEAHKAHLHHFVSIEKAEQQPKKNKHVTETAAKNEPTPLTALSMSRLSSLSLVSSIFGRSSIASGSSRATSVSDRCYMKEEHCCQDNMSSLEDDDCISQIENISGHSYCQQQQIEHEEDHPFYDLAGKRSFKAGSFCGSVYHDNDQEQQYQLPSQNENSAEIRWRRRQRRQRHQKHLEQRQQQYFSDNESSTSDNVSTFSSISGYSNVNVHSRHQNNMYHPLSPVTPPPNYLADGNYFQQFMQQDSGFYKDLTQSWLTSSNFNDCQENDWANSILQKTNIYPERNVLDEAMSFLDSLSENGDDGGFGEDMYLLLRNPDLCCKPLSEIESTIHELRQQEKPKDISIKKYLLDMVNPVAWCQMGIQLSTDVVYKATCSSLQWCRFLSVLAAAVVISILKGPEDIRRYSAAL